MIVKPTTHLPTVPRDSGELIQLLENTVLPNSSCFLVTAEVASLYPNVDTEIAVVALDLLHRDARVPETPLLIQLARLVLDNNYLSSESVHSGHFSPRVLYCFGHSFLLEFPGAFYYKKDRIKLTRCISNVSICFQDLCLYKDIS